VFEPVDPEHQAFKHRLEEVLPVGGEGSCLFELADDFKHLHEPFDGPFGTAVCDKRANLL
jgi:hypothetical protein